MITLLINILAIAAVIASATIFAASWYDIRAVSQGARLAKLRRFRQPSVAILINADMSSSETLQHCLQSIRNNRYRRLTVLVTSSQPNADIKQFIHSYQQQHANLQLHYYTSRGRVSQTVRFCRAYRRTTKHDYILTLVATDMLSPATIRQAIRHFRDDKRLGELQFSRRRQPAPTLLSLMQRYSEVGNQLIKKAVRPTSRRTLARVQTGVLYEYHYFTTKSRRQRHHRRYAATLTITTQQAYTLQLPRPVIIWWLLSTATVWYCIATANLAATLQSNAPLLLSWASICLWTVIAIWSETAARPLEKIALSYGLLLAPLLLFIQSIWLSLVLPIAVLYTFLRTHYRAWYVKNWWRRSQGTSLASDQHHALSVRRQWHRS